MSTKLRRGIIGGVVVMALIGVGMAFAAREFKPAERLVPTTKVERGPVEISVMTTGEFRAPHSSTLVAPQVNGTLQIVSMLQTGMKVKAGDVVVEFDPSEQEYNYEQAESQLRQAEQDIIKAKADQQVTAAQDKVTLLKAKFELRRAELEVQRNELVSEIDAKKNDLALEEARRRLKQIEDDVKSRAASGQAGIRVLEAKRGASQIAMQVAKQNIENMTLRAPLDGIVSAKENRDSTGGFFTTGMVLPEYRAGDLTWPGRPLAEVFDVAQMEVQAKISEGDRANVNPNQPVEVRVDARPGLTYSGKVKSVAGLASRNMWSASSQKRFEASFQLDQPNAELRPGVSATLLIHGQKLQDVLYLPPQCLFENDGKQYVYKKSGSGFEPQELKVKFRTENRIVVEGIEQGVEVALVNPTAKGPGGSAKSGASGGAAR
ncbi:MAG TPA: HlyD family efflux transporter periplasmic adaptor subunit [Terriglobales bacterium]|nr:HlyD family efflux transporter periplasmic adaptor subunit [Terriglobales bacterium]